MKKPILTVAGVLASFGLVACGAAGSTSSSKSDVSVPNTCGQNSWCSTGFNDGLSEVKSLVSGGGTVGSVDEIYLICGELRSSLASGPDFDGSIDYTGGCYDAVYGYLIASGSW